MKIGILSDIHVDLEHRDPQAVVEAIAEVAAADGAEALIVAGDVANDYRTTLGALRTLEARSGARVLFVPGNHDIWNEHHPRLTAWDTYAALGEFSGNLANGPLELGGGWVAVGDLGWYDYSFGGPGYSRRDFDRMQIGRRLWQDKVKALWGRPTVEMHAYFYAKLAAQLEGLAGRRIILVTHAVSTRAFTVQPPDAAWDYLNAFLGSAQYGDLAIAHAVAYAICGHVHYRREEIRQGTRFICQCLNYAREWVDNSDPRVEVRRAFKTITL
jgi:putative phosphoesterase